MSGVIFTIFKKKLIYNSRLIVEITTQIVKYIPSKSTTNANIYSQWILIFTIFQQKMIEINIHFSQYGISI